jgi:hypothetical protein
LSSVTVRISSTDRSTRDKGVLAATFEMSEEFGHLSAIVPATPVGRVVDAFGELSDAHDDGSPRIDHYRPPDAC